MSTATEHNLEIGVSRSLYETGRDICRAAYAAKKHGITTMLTVTGQPVAMIVPVSDEANSRKDR